MTLTSILLYSPPILSHIAIMFVYCLGFNNFFLPIETLEHVSHFVGLVSDVVCHKKEVCEQHYITILSNVNTFRTTYWH